MHNSLKIRQIKKWRMLAFCLLIGFSAFAQTEEPTKLLRIDKSKNDIQFLDSMYNIENVSMDQVFYVEYHDSLQTNVLRPISTQPSGIGEPNPANVKFNIPAATPVANSSPTAADSKPPPPIQLQEQVQNTSSPIRSTTQRSTSSSSTRSAKSRSKKMKMKRVRLKKKKRSPRSSKGRCYRF